MELLEMLEKGDLEKDLTAELQEVSVQARNTGKPGTITVKFTVTPRGVHQIEVDAKVDSKIPKPARKTTLLYVDDFGRLSARDPRQMDLSELVDLETGEVKDE